MQLKLLFVALLFTLNWQQNLNDKTIYINYLESYQVHNEAEEVIINETDMMTGLLYIGMEYSDFKVWCEENNGWYEEIFMQTNFKDINEGYVGAISEDISAWTSLENGDLISTFSVSGDIKTSLGLKDGDSIYKMMELYGDNYVLYDFGYDDGIYEYYMKTHYFQVNFKGDSVKGWKISNKTLEETQSEVK